MYADVHAAPTELTWAACALSTEISRYHIPFKQERTYKYRESDKEYFSKTGPCTKNASYIKYALTLVNNEGLTRSSIP